MLVLTMLMCATRFLMPAPAPESSNSSTGMTVPSLKMELPSGLMGCSKMTPVLASAPTWTWTQTVKAALAVLPSASVAVQVTVVWPRANLLPEAGAQETGTGFPALSVAGGDW